LSPKLLRMPSSSGSFVAVKWKVNDSMYKISRRPHFFVSHSTRNCLNQSRYFLKICCHTKFQDPTLCGASVAPIAKARTAAMLVLFAYFTKLSVAQII
jgi:hypothetical protein